MITEPSKLQEMRDRQADAKAQAERDLVAVMRTEAGRRFMVDLIDGRCAVMADPRRASEAETYHALGRQSVGRELFAAIQRLCLPEWEMMRAEATTRELERRRALEVPEVPGT